MKDRKLFNLLYLLIAASIMFFNVGCSDDETAPVTPPETIVESDLLVKYLEGADGGYINNLAPAVVGA
nr:hypothetical protein [Ignavibacteriaceae bacterium]